MILAGVLVAVVIARSGDDGGTSGDSGERGLTGGDFHSLVADPLIADRLYVGGHSAVSVSADGGRSWRPVASLENADAMGWGFTGGATWVSGHPGLSISTDGAASFARHNDGLPDTDVHAFGTTGETLVAAGPGLGVVSSTDGGETWNQLATDAGQAFFGRISAAADDPDHLVAADAAAGPVASSDGGRTWRLLTDFPATWVSTDERLTTIIASNADGAIRSTDGGDTWDAIELPDGASLVEIDPHHADRLYAGVHVGSSVQVFVSDDDGASWRAP